jgi:hypothetical protein
MAVGRRLEVSGNLRDQTGQILRSPEPAGSAGTMAYRGVLEEVGTSLYGSGTLATDQSGSRNSDCCNRPDVLRKEEELAWEQEQVKKHIMMVGSWPCMVLSEVYING